VVHAVSETMSMLKW